MESINFISIKFLLFLIIFIKIIFKNKSNYSKMKHEYNDLKFILLIFIIIL